MKIVIKRKMKNWGGVAFAMAGGILCLGLMGCGDGENGFKEAKSVSEIDGAGSSSNGETLSQEDPSPAATASDEEAATVEPVTVEEGVGGNGEAVFLDFALMREIETSEDGLPKYNEALEELDGKRVFAEGYMVPYDDLEDMRKFMLFEYPCGCFFCSPPSEAEVIIVRQDTEEKAPYSYNYLEVEGILRLQREVNEEPLNDLFIFVIDKATLTTIE